MRLSDLFGVVGLHEEASVGSVDGEGEGHLQHCLLVLAVVDSGVRQVDYPANHLKIDFFQVCLSLTLHLSRSLIIPLSPHLSISLFVFVSLFLFSSSEILRDFKNGT